MLKLFSHNRTYALPLHIAVRRGNPPVVAPIYDRGFQINMLGFVPQPNLQPLHIAVRRGNPPVVAPIYDRGFQINMLGFVPQPNLQRYLKNL